MKFIETRTYKVERSNVTYFKGKKSMICNFTITHIETKEKYVYKNIYLARDNKDAYIIFPTTSEKVYINREEEILSSLLSNISSS